MNSQQTEQRTGEPRPLSPSSIEIERGIYDKLNDICTKEKVALRELTSEMLRCMLIFHKGELKTIVERMRKCRVS